MWKSVIINIRSSFKVNELLFSNSLILTSAKFKIRKKRAEEIPNIIMMVSQSYF